MELLIVDSDSSAPMTTVLFFVNSAVPKLFKTGKIHPKVDSFSTNQYKYLEGQIFI